MRKSYGRRVSALAACTALLLSLSIGSRASNAHPPNPAVSPAHRATEAAVNPAAEPAREYRLRMYELHTRESIDVVYRVGDRYIPSALDRLNEFLRDHRTQDVKAYDPREFDVLHSLMASLGKPDGVIDIVCGYRTPATNHHLRTLAADTGVALHSQHMLGKAIDIRVPGVSTLALRNAALALHAGGVGFYPVSQFVHVDVGPVRTWQYR